MPRNLAEVTTRQKEIQYSSRTRAGTNHFKRIQRVRNTLDRLLAKLPDELQDSEEFKVLRDVADRKVYNVVHLIYRSKKYEGSSKDYEFSSLTMRDHWRAGRQDALTTLANKKIFERPTDREGVRIFDLLKAN